MYQSILQSLLAGTLCNNESFVFTKFVSGYLRFTAESNNFICNLDLFSLMILQSLFHWLESCFVVLRMGASLYEENHLHGFVNSVIEEPIFIRYYCAGILLRFQTRMN